MSYHLRRKDREIKDILEIEKISSNKYATLVLCKDKEPYMVTLSYRYDEKEKYLYFHESSIGQKIEFIRSNPIVCLTIPDDKSFIENECGYSYKSLVLKGEIEFVNKEEERICAIKVLLKHFESGIKRMMQKVNQQSDTCNSYYKRSIRLIK